MDQVPLLCESEIDSACPFLHLNDNLMAKLLFVLVRKTCMLPYWILLKCYSSTFGPFMSCQLKNSTHLFLPDVKTDCENCSQGVGKLEMEIDVFSLNFQDRENKSNCSCCSEAVSLWIHLEVRRLMSYRAQVLFGGTAVFRSIEQ